MSWRGVLALAAALCLPTPVSADWLLAPELEQQQMALA